MRAARLLGALGLALGASLATPALPTALSSSLPVVGTTPASAESCSGAGGVTVVVDYRGQGGRGLVEGCAAGGGGGADTLFAAVGTQMTFASREPGFVCRVNAVPSSDPCVNASPANAYWGLFWSTGKPGAGWTYASSGVRSLQVPDGGLVAWSWQSGGGQQPPSTSPVRAAAPAPAPAPGGSGSGGSGSGGSGASGGGTVTRDGSGGGPSTPTPDADPSTTPDADDSGTRGTDGADGGADGGARRDGAGRGRDGRGADRKGRAGGRDAERRKGDGARTGADDERTERSASSPLTDADGDTEQVSSASEEDPAGLPAWVPAAVIGVLGLGAAGAVLQRRRTRGSA